MIDTIYTYILIVAHRIKYPPAPKSQRKLDIVSNVESGRFLTLVIHAYLSVSLSPCRSVALSLAADGGEKHVMGNSLKEAIAKETESNDSTSNNEKNSDKEEGWAIILWL